MRKFWTAVLAVALGAGIFIGQACSPPSESDKIKNPEKLKQPAEVEQQQQQEQQDMPAEDQGGEEE
jgi:hypothetical protein